jgi:hypothetical protein
MDYQTNSYQTNSYQTPAQAEPTLSELFSVLSNQVSQLFRQEVQLAQAEMTRKASRAARNAAVIGIGAMFGMGAFYALVATLILVLSQYMASWLAALVVGLVLAIVAGIMIQSGINKLKSIDPAPRRTIETMRENKEWLTEQI